MTATVHRARTGHPCNGYGTSLHGTGHRIEPGVLYVREVVFPGQEGNEEGDQPVTSRMCEPCVDRYLGGQYIRDKYQVPARLGQPVEWRGQQGTIVDLRGSAVWARFGSRVVPVHPTDLRYLKAEGAAA